MKRSSTTSKLKKMAGVNKVAVFPGSFDPFTLGHHSIVTKALPLFDKIIIAIGQNSTKQPAFDLQKRIDIMHKRLLNIHQCDDCLIQ